MQTTTNNWVTEMLNNLYFTNTEILHLKSIHYKIEICKLLGWDELKYATFQMNAGLNYLVYQTKNDEVIIDQLQSDKFFWNWWKLHWSKREEEFIETKYMLLLELSKDAKLNMYISLHDAKELAYEIYPDGQVLATDYKKMIGQKIKKEVSK